MKMSVLKHMLFTMLTTLMCAGFSSYVVLNQYQVATEVGISINEEDSETAEKSITESNYFVNDHFSANTLTVLITSQAFHYRNKQLPDFILTPNTPPPNLA